MRAGRVPSRSSILGPPLIKGNASDRRLLLFASEERSVIWIEMWASSEPLNCECRATTRYVTSSREGFTDSQQIDVTDDGGGESHASPGSRKRLGMRVGRIVSCIRRRRARGLTDAGHDPADARPADGRFAEPTVRSRCRDSRVRHDHQSASSRPADPVDVGAGRLPKTSAPLLLGSASSSKPGFSLPCGVTQD